MPLDLQRHADDAKQAVCTDAERRFLDAFADRINADPATLAAIDAEVGRARAKFPTNYTMLSALTEEVGELAEALMGNGNTGAGHRDVHKEAIQTACMAVRLLEEGDASHGYRPPHAPIQPVQPWPAWWAELQRIFALAGYGNAQAADDWAHHWHDGRTPAEALQSDLACA